jgi:DNA-directed RNA polymerase specialized sigma24 family protein
MPKKNARMAGQILAGLPERERRALTRFYVDGEPADVVCREAGLTEEEFRLIKTRAKDSFLTLMPKPRAPRG